MTMMALLISILGTTVRFSIASALLILCLIIFSRRRSSRLRRERRKGKRVIAFFHPYCSSGGGGERVLWKIVEVMGELHQQGFPIQVLIYTIDPPSPSYKPDLLKHVTERFSITASTNLELTFIHLHDFKHYLAPSSRFSLLVESFGTMRLALKALQLSYDLMPDIFVDTTGCAFTYVVANILFACKVIAYVHYPTISTDMLNLVWERRRSAYNHQEYISKSLFTTVVKLIYYTIFAVLYGMVGSLASLVLVNSTWTYNHVRSLWKWAAWSNRIKITFPPCPVLDLQKNDIVKNREPAIVSIGQFRPEKDHVLQIESFATLLERHPELKPSTKLILIGSCRGPDDDARLELLKNLTEKLGLAESVSFVVNQRYSVIVDWLQRASMGIHTMWNEHFGIGIVEMMAAGLITCAHNSGGPKSDIIVPFEGQSTGFLAATAEEYADVMYHALTMDQQEARALRRRAQASASRFSDQVFAASFKEKLLDSKLL